MDHQNLTPQPAGGGHCSRANRHGFRFGKLLFVVAVAAAAGFAGSYAGKAFSMGPFGHRGAMSAPMDPARMDEHVERMVKHFAVETDATPEQREKLNTIANAIPIKGGSVEIVIYDATALKLWVSYAKGKQEAWERPATPLDLRTLDADKDGHPDLESALPASRALKPSSR